LQHIFLLQNASSIARNKTPLLFQIGNPDVARRFGITPMCVSSPRLKLNAGVFSSEIFRREVCQNIKQFNCKEPKERKTTE
jgi:hypothetical protein